MRIVFVGTGEIGVPALRALQRSGHELVAVVTQPDKPVGRDQRIQAPPIKQAAEELGLPILQPAGIKESTAVEQIRGCHPDVIVVMAYGQILPRNVLEAPSLACINLHASLLPKWRGAAPIQAAIAAGDQRTGLTVLYMDEGLDTGDILSQETTEIAPHDTGGTLHDRLAEMAPDILLKSLESIERRTAPRTPQNSADATYAPKLSRESGRIDWTEPADAIERKIRAYNPWPSAFTEINTPPAVCRKLKVFSARIIEQNGKPGQIFTTDSQLVVATGNRAISLSEVQLEGRKRMSAPEFLRGNQWIKSVPAF